MAIMDGNLIFGEEASITTGGLVGDVIDLNSFEASGARDAIARGEPIWWVNFITEAGAGGTSAYFDLKTHSAEGIDESTGASYTRSPVFDLADLEVGVYWNICLPVTSLEVGRYVGAVVSAEGTFTALGVTSYLTLSPPPFGWSAIKDWRA